MAHSSTEMALSAWSSALSSIHRVFFHRVPEVRGPSPPRVHVARAGPKGLKGPKLKRRMR